MPFDSSGTFNRERTWGAEASAGIKIRSDNHDMHDTDLANGLSNCITKNGSTQPNADIPMNSHRLINLAEPTQAQDAATKNYVDNFRAFPTSISISGADEFGQLTFSSLTGTNGLTWTSTSMSFQTRKGVANESLNRWVFNNTATPWSAPAGDVVNINSFGAINSGGYLTNNLSHDGTNWRTVSPGTGTAIVHAGGSISFQSNDVATITNPYALATMRSFASLTNGSGSVILTLAKTGPIAGVQKTAYIQTTRDGNLRWVNAIGNSAAETATDRVGSDWSLTAYNNAGGGGVQVLHFSRSTAKATFGGGAKFDGDVTIQSRLISTSTVMNLSTDTNGAIFLRPNGADSEVEQAWLGTTGDWNVSSDIYAGKANDAVYGTYLGAGRRGKGAGTAPNSGNAGSYDNFWHNQYWSGSDEKVYVGSTFIGDIAWQCDYRIKKDIAPIPSTWEAVKRLNPVSYTQRAYDIWTEDDTVRWGFVAHELQERLFKGAASGEKDGLEIQTPNLMAILAGLTRALQEAIARIETLEAA